MLNAIINNPFRTLGVFTNTPLRECVSNINKIKAYASIGRPFVGSLDLNSTLPPCDRSIENTEKAIASINQSDDKLLNSLFWFCNVTPLDEISLKYISEGNVTNAKNSLMSSRATFSGILNSAVYFFIEGAESMAIELILSVIHTPKYKRQLINEICGDTYSISEEDLAHKFLDKLAEEMNYVHILCGIPVEYEQDKQYVIEKEITSAVNRINDEIRKAKAAEDSPKAQLYAGKELMEATKDDLKILKEASKGDDLIRTNSVIDNLAEAILQCGINYYNDSDENGSAKRALPLQKYAMEIAVGKRVKDRCTENYKTIKANAEAEPPVKVSKEASQIDSLFVQFRNKSGIDSAILLLDKCAPILAQPTNPVGRVYGR